ncbi:hypothetical protein EMIT07CA2_550162 [Brevibacillus sp. IT-7CA2]
MKGNYWVESCIAHELRHLLPDLCFQFVVPISFVISSSFWYFYPILNIHTFFTWEKLGPTGGASFSLSPSMTEKSWQVWDDGALEW